MPDLLSSTALASGTVQQPKGFRYPNRRETHLGSAYHFVELFSGERLTAYRYNRLPLLEVE